MVAVRKAGQVFLWRW